MIYVYMVSFYSNVCVYVLRVQLNIFYFHTYPGYIYVLHNIYIYNTEWMYKHTYIQIYICIIDAYHVYFLLIYINATYYNMFAVVALPLWSLERTCRMAPSGRLSALTKKRSPKKTQRLWRQKCMFYQRWVC